MTYHQQWLYTVAEDGGMCEIFNGERLLGNLRQTPACGIFTVAGQDCEWTDGTLPLALDPCPVDEDGEQTWPELDFASGVTGGTNPAPWWDGVTGSPSSKAYGFWIEEWTGLDGGHHRRNAAQRANRRGGANFGSLSSQSRVWKMNVVLVGETGSSLESLFRWLEDQLINVCDPCGGEEMLIRTSCPPDDAPGVDLYSVKGAALLEGPTWEEPPIERLGCYMRRVSFTIGVADPCLYSCADACLYQEPFDFIVGCIPIGLWMGCGDCVDMEPYRMCCAIPGAHRGISSPVVTIENESTLTSPSFRIYGMNDPLEVGCDPCSLNTCQTIRTTQIPPGSALQIDSSQRKVLFRGPDTGQVWVDGTPFLDLDPGTAASFLALTCDPGWVAIEPLGFCGELENVLVSVDIITRVGCS